MHAATQRPAVGDYRAAVAPSNHWAHGAARMLVSSFFIVASVSDMTTQAGNPFLAVPQVDLAFALNIIVYCMAFALMVGKFVHIAGAFLALITMWFGYNAYAAGLDTLADLWRNFAISGALMTMATQAHVTRDTTRTAGRRRTRGKVIPRRITPRTDEIGTEQASPRSREMRHAVARPVTQAPVFATRRSQ